MTKTKRIMRGDILKAAAEIVREEGEDKLGVRAIAGVLGCSTQPIYSCFAGGITELKAALFKDAVKEYRARIDGYIREGKYPRYMSYGMGFIRFAREEKGLFRYLFFTDREEMGMDPLFDDIAAVIAESYKTDIETARSFHLDMAIYTYGLGMIVNTGRTMSEEETSEALKREFFALYSLYFPDRPKFWN